MGVAGYSRSRADEVGLCFSPPTIDTSKIGLKPSLAAVTWGPLQILYLRGPLLWPRTLLLPCRLAVPPSLRCYTIYPTLSLPCGSYIHRWYQASLTGGTQLSPDILHTATTGDWFPCQYPLSPIPSVFPVHPHYPTHGRSRCQAHLLRTAWQGR